VESLGPLAFLAQGVILVASSTLSNFNPGRESRGVFSLKAVLFIQIGPR
jgi:hypothetical protein